VGCFRPHCSPSANCCGCPNCSSTLETPLERDAEAARIAAVLGKSIAAMPEFNGLHAYHIDYVTNSGDHDYAHFMDGISFRKNPEGKFIHHKSWKLQISRLLCRLPRQ
jgi:hypothetical protein